MTPSGDGATMGEGREASASRAGDSATGLTTVCGGICGSSVVPTLRLLPFVLESDSDVLDSDLWCVPRPSPVEDRRMSVPTRERKDSLGDGDGEGLDIAVRQRHSREGEDEKRLSTSEVT
jgi:hypothetical protein